MRLRNVKNKAAILENSPYLVRDGETYAGSWHEVFQNNHPIYIEIGMGKGKFLTEMALLHPEINFVGIERYDSVLARALPKLPVGLSNVRVLRVDATNIEAYFHHEIARIYLNFSDPWPKDRHQNRRLSSIPFLERYDKICQSSYEVYLKTDNSSLFAFSLEAMSQHGFLFDKVVLDVPKTPDFEYVMSEYEQKFRGQGNPIYLVLARKSIVHVDVKKQK